MYIIYLRNKKTYIIYLRNKRLRDSYLEVRRQPQPLSVQRSITFLSRNFQLQVGEEDKSEGRCLSSMTEDSETPEETTYILTKNREG